MKRCGEIIEDPYGFHGEVNYPTHCSDKAVRATEPRIGSLVIWLFLSVVAR